MNRIMNKKITALALTVIFSASVFSGCGKKPDATQAETGVNVTVYKVKDSSIDSKVKYTGTLAACDSVSVTSKVSAKALVVSVEEGDFVKSGDVLARLDQTDLRLSYEQAHAAYNSAVAGYNSVVNSSTKQSTAQAQQALVSAQSSYDQAKTNYDRELTLYNSQSSVKLAEQRYNDAKAAYEREKSLYESNTTLVSAQNAFNTAKDNYDRMAQLYEMGGISKLEFDNAKVAYDNAAAAYETAKTSSSAAMDNAYSNLVSAEENLKTTRTSASAALDAAKAAFTNAENALANAKQNITLTANANAAAKETAAASVESARAAMNLAANSVKNATITAPISGYIAKCTATEGQMVAQGVECFVIKNTNILNAEINVTESVIPTINIGTKAFISVTSAKIDNLEGSVTLVNSVKNDQTGLYSVNIAINNDSGDLKAGMLADITLVTESLDGIIKIPSEALINKDNTYSVYIADGNKAKKVTVETGITDDEYTEITNGISSGDEVIVSGKDFLSEKNNEIKITGEYKKKNNK